jgi:hypothetical protein
VAERVERKIRDLGDYVGFCVRFLQGRFLNLPALSWRWEKPNLKSPPLCVFPSTEQPSRSVELHAGHFQFCRKGCAKRHRECIPNAGESTLAAEAHSLLEARPRRAAGTGQWARLTVSPFPSGRSTAGWRNESSMPLFVPHGANRTGNQYRGCSRFGPGGDHIAQSDGRPDDASVYAGRGRGSGIDSCGKGD